MRVIKIFNNESGVSTVIETVLLFGISVIFLGIIYTSFQGLNERQKEIVMKEQYLSLGNDIANKISEMTIDAKASLSEGSAINIKSDINMPLKIADNTYSVKLETGKIILESTSGPYVIVNIPINNDIYLAKNSTLYSSGDKFELMYDSQSGAVFFSEGGVIPAPDFNAPTISFISPDEGANINNTTLIDVFPWDDVGVTKVEYYVDSEYEATSDEDWLWDTKTMSDGNYNVTAIAYDSAGHSTAVTRQFKLENGIFFPPEITIISPVDFESTDFRKPTIKFKIKDDKGIDFDSIIFLVDGDNRISNVTYSNISSKLTTLTYIPSSNMNISDHVIDVLVNDTDGIFAEKVWNFTITPITDSDNPDVSIEWPGMSNDLVPGSVIRMTYTASDASSGIDNLTLNVTRNDGLYYNQFQQVSEYPDSIKNTGSISWPFDPNILVEGKNYTYKIKVYDRSGKNKSATVGPFSILPGQASELEVDASGKSLTSGNKVIKNIYLKDNVSDSVVVSITKITVSWSPNGENINEIKFDGFTYWSGNKQSGNLLLLTSSYTAQPSLKSMRLIFDSDISGKAFTIVFQMSDSTTKTITFNT